MSGAVVRAFRPGDRAAVLDLRARVFEGLDPEREERRWTWQFDHNPFTREDVPPTWVAEHEGVIVGNYGMLPLRFSIDGEYGFGLCGMDFCVDPEHRHLGLGMRLTKAFIDTPADVHVVTSPTPDAAKLMAYYRSEVLRGDDEPCLWVWAGGAAPDGGDGAVLERVERFDERVDRVYERAVADHRLLLTRDRFYLNWRYVEYPFGRARITLASEASGPAGFSVVQREGGGGRAHLCELFAPRSERFVFEALLRDAISSAIEEGIGELYTFQRDSAVHPLLERAGFHVVQGHGMSAVCRPPTGLSQADWYLSAGDGDILFGVGR